MKSEYLAEVKVITIPNYAIGLMKQLFPALVRVIRILGNNSQNDLFNLSPFIASLIKVRCNGVILNLWNYNYGMLYFSFSIWVLVIILY